MAAAKKPKVVALSGEDAVIAASAQLDDSWTAPTGETFKLNKRRLSRIEIARSMRLEREATIQSSYELLLRTYERIIDPADVDRFLDWIEKFDDAEAMKYQQEIFLLVIGRPTTPSATSTDG